MILGGTSEASALCAAVARAGWRGQISFAGRVARPRRQPLAQRVGGFGGAPGLADFLRAEGVTHLIDATHPFAAQISRNAVAASARAGVPLVALSRPPWTAAAGDNWQRVADIPAAAAALKRPRRTILLAIGRLNLPAFAVNPQHRYLLRLIAAPSAAPPFPDYHIVIERGPFCYQSDLALLRRHRVDLLVSKNSGGAAAYAKIAAARTLGLAVLMIERPALPQRRELHSVDEVLAWIAHAGAERGV